MDQRDDAQDLYAEQEAESGTVNPDQEHPEQDAHGGSMAPGVADDTGRPAMTDQTTGS